jgi:polynucleotide 5'-hydroxyl-kinase GRC3/NOL9
MRESAGAPLAPVIVNTPGWVKGPGLSILMDVLAALAPTHLVCISSGNARKDLPPEPFWNTQQLPALQRIDLPGLACCAQQDTRPLSATSSASDQAFSQPRSAAEERTARLHTWACRVLQEHEDCAGDGLLSRELCLHRRMHNNYTSLVAAQLYACAPLRVCLDDLHVVHLHEDLPPGGEAAALNGTMAALMTVPQASSKSTSCIDMLVRTLSQKCGMVHWHFCTWNHCDVPCGGYLLMQSFV